MPGFVGANEVNRGYFWAKPFISGSVSVSKRDYVLFSSRKEREGGDVRIGCRRSRVVCKTEPIPVSPSPLIQQPLVCSIPRPLRLEQIREFFELVFPGRENHHSGIENVRPSDVGCSRELVVQSEQVRDRADR